MKFELTKYNRYVSAEELVDDIKRCAGVTGRRSLTCVEYKSYGKYSYKTVIKHFGLWNKAVRASGLKPTVARNVTKNELLRNLKNVWLTLGRQPFRMDMVTDISDYSWTIYRTVFGSFRNALEEFVKLANKRRVHKLDTPFIDIDAARNKTRTRRNVSYGLRHKVMKRDGYKCVLCGTSPAYGNAVNLQIDHIKPYSKGGETVLQNLQTLCEACNLGKGNR
jgi:hypothetical protein